MHQAVVNLAEDPGELRDLSRKYPAKHKALLKLWKQYVNTNGVIVSDAGPFAVDGL